VAVVVRGSWLLEGLDFMNDEPLHVLVVLEGELLDCHGVIVVKRAVDGPEGTHADLGSAGGRT
jgi:hypothetical protein